MASKYIKKFKVPEGFENLLNDFAKEILRNKPNDILDFGIWYFQGLENHQDPTKMDYPFKGTNLPESFTSQGYQKPKIISAENKMTLSTGDNNRLERSMQKRNEINKTNVPLRDDVFREKGLNDQIVENFGLENYHFVEEGIPNNNEYKVHNNPADREFNINEVNGSGFNYKEGQFPNTIDAFEMGYNYKGGLQEMRNVKFPEMKKESIIIKEDEIPNASEYIKTGGMATTEKKEEKKEEKKPKKEKVVKPPDYDAKDYDDRSSNFPDSNKDKIVEDTVSKLGINPDKNQIDRNEIEINDDDESSNPPDSNKDKIIQHTASLMNRRIENTTEENFKEKNINENVINETNRENYVEDSNVQVETTSEKYQITVEEKDGKRTVVILKNGEEITEDELPEEYKIKLENMKNQLNEDDQNDNEINYNENIENENNENIENVNNENIENENNENIENVNNENIEENKNENIENVDENNILPAENIEENNNIGDSNNLNENSINQNFEDSNINNNIENIDEANLNKENVELMEDEKTENNKNQYAIETITETKTNEKGEQTTEKKLIVTKNGVEISTEEIPEDIQQKLTLIQKQIDEGKAKIETIENTGKIENTNKEIVSETNKKGEEEIIETTTKEVKELKDGQVVNQQKTFTTTKKKRKRRGENEEGLESDTDEEFGNEEVHEDLPSEAQQKEEEN